MGGWGYFHASTCEKKRKNTYQPNVLFLPLDRDAALHPPAGRYVMRDLQVKHLCGRDRKEQPNNEPTRNAIEKKGDQHKIKNKDIDAFS